MSAIPAAGVGVSLAERGGQAAAKALTADIIVINGKYYREIRTHEPTGRLTKAGRPQMRTVRRLEPTNIDVHINPVVVGIGAAVMALAGGVALWWLGMGVVPTSDARKAEIKAEILIEKDGIVTNETNISLWQIELDNRIATGTCVDPGGWTDGHRHRYGRTDVCAILRENIAHAKANTKTRQERIATLERKLKVPFTVDVRPRFGDNPLVKI